MDRLYPNDDFEAVIRIYSPEEGGPTTPVCNGGRWDFSYADPIPEAGVWAIWPDFYIAGGDSRSRYEPLPVGVDLLARMFIMAGEMREVQRRHIRQGVRFYCMEGPHRVAAGEVTKITGLMAPRTESMVVARKLPGDGASVTAAINDTPTDAFVLNPYRRHAKLAYWVFSLIALNCAFSLFRLFPDSWISTIVPFLSAIAMCILIYLMARERREVKSRLLRFRGLPGHCMHCGWYQQNKKLKRCSSCAKLLDAKPGPGW